MAVEELTFRSVVPYGRGYEHRVGTAVVALDAHDPANHTIVDLDRALPDADGRVRFETDVVLLRPPVAAGLLHVVANRGLVTALPLGADADTGAPASGHIDAGDGFVLDRALSVLWVGWQWDVERRPGAVGLDVPEATGPGGRPLVGPVRLGFQPLADTAHRRLADLAPPWMGRFATYPVAGGAEAEAVLTEREWFNGPPRVIEPSRWRFAREVDGRPVPSDEHVWLEGGFRARVHYEFVYPTRRCPVTGAGLAAVRDVVAHVRPAFSHTLAYGVSQSGRWLRQFVFDTANADEQGRRVFDGVLCHLAGGRRGEFNHRYAQPSTMNALGFTHLPPYSPADGLFARARAAGTAPLTLFTNSATEYWRGDASLVHPAPVTEEADWRAYLYAGAHHAGRLAGFVDQMPVQLPANLVEIVWLGRAHLVALERWVADGIEPPPSAVPRADDGTGVSRPAALVQLAGLNTMAGLLPPDPHALPGLLPLDLGPEVDAGIGRWPPVVTGPARPCLVSALDDDGNEIAGVRLPDIAVPLAPSLGWNPELPRPGVPVELWNLLGGRVAWDRAEIVRRYRDRDGYLDRVRAAAEALVARRHLLAADVDAIVTRAGADWDAAIGGPPATGWAGRGAGRRAAAAASPASGAPTPRPAAPGRSDRRC